MARIVIKILSNCLLVYKFFILFISIQFNLFCPEFLKILFYLLFLFSLSIEYCSVWNYSFSSYLLLIFIFAFINTLNSVFQYLWFTFFFSFVIAFKSKYVIEYHLYTFRGKTIGSTYNKLHSFFKRTLFCRIMKFFYSQIKILLFVNRRQCPGSFV